MVDHTRSQHHDGRARQPCRYGLGHSDPNRFNAGLPFRLPLLTPAPSGISTADHAVTLGVAPPSRSPAGFPFSLPLRLRRRGVLDR